MRRSDLQSIEGSIATVVTSEPKEESDGKAPDEMMR